MAQKQVQNSMIIQDTTSNPAPLGLCGFALTTVLLNIHNAGFFGLDTMILAMGIFYGGLAQVIVGIMEWKKNNTFGTVAFTSYGFFWIALVALILMPKMGLGEAPSHIAMGCFLGVWGIFSIPLFICTFKLNKALQLVFGTLVLLFFMLTVADFTGNAALKHAAGWEGILCGALAFYAAMAQVINEVFGREVCPLGAVK